ncbi:hypothetical protein PHMEG_00015317 [Phytophthora megakarya]|uniref:Uncharacterized protein n=1 Tax=Phytophthora megakarya TaxID=4795 RepID=A0A225W1K6_9STRA|nr:hypothetical protein PHMEG_00015317 [Phytophthora megakarya]
MYDVQTKDHPRGQEPEGSTSHVYKPLLPEAVLNYVISTEFGMSPYSSSRSIFPGSRQNLGLTAFFAKLSLNSSFKHYTEPTQCEKESGPSHVAVLVEVRQSRVFVCKGAGSLYQIQRGERPGLWTGCSTASFDLVPCASYTAVEYESRH